MGKSRARNRAVLPKREGRERERVERVEKRGIRNRRKGERAKRENAQ